MPTSILMSTADSPHMKVGAQRPSLSEPSAAFNFDSPPITGLPHPSRLNSAATPLGCGSSDHSFNGIWRRHPQEGTAPSDSLVLDSLPPLITLAEVPEKSRSPSACRQTRRPLVRSGKAGRPVGGLQ
jgi:hypothetical protein